MKKIIISILITLMILTINGEIINQSGSWFYGTAGILSKDSSDTNITSTWFYGTAGIIGGDSVYTPIGQSCTEWLNSQDTIQVFTNAVIWACSLVCDSGIMISEYTTDTTGVIVSDTINGVLAPVYNIDTTAELIPSTTYFLRWRFEADTGTNVDTTIWLSQATRDSTDTLGYWLYDNNVIIDSILPRTGNINGGDLVTFYGSGFDGQSLAVFGDSTIIITPSSNVIATGTTKAYHRWGDVPVSMAEDTIIAGFCYLEADTSIGSVDFRNCMWMINPAALGADTSIDTLAIGDTIPAYRGDSVWVIDTINNGTFDEPYYANGKLTLDGDRPNGGGGYIKGDRRLWDVRHYTIIVRYRFNTTPLVFANNGVQIAYAEDYNGEAGALAGPTVGSLGGRGRFEAYNYSTPGYSTKTTPNQIVLDNNDHMLAMTWSDNSKFSVYVDGVNYTDSVSDTGSPPEYLQAIEVDQVVGGDIFPSAELLQNPVQGDIYYVAVYNRTMSDSEIARLYSLGNNLGLAAVDNGDGTMSLSPAPRTPSTTSSLERILFRSQIKHEYKRLRKWMGL